MKQYSTLFFNKKSKFPVWFLTVICICLSFLSCLKQLDFETEQLDQLFVFDGVINNVRGTQKVSISRTGVYGKQVFEPVTNADVQLFDDVGGQWAYQELNNGSYYLFDFAGEIGRSYHIEAQISNGSTYRSLPEKLNNPVPIDSTLINFGTEAFNAQYGEIAEPENCNVFVEIKLPASEEGIFLKWQTENIFQFTELPNALGIFNRCFIPGELDRQGITLLSSRFNDTEVPIVRRVAKKGLDWTFWETQFFNVYQSSITAEAYAYWQKIDRVVNDVGSLFDAPPASVTGNMINATDPELPVLGYFRAEATTLKRVKVIVSDVPINRPERYCGVNRFASPSECSNCLNFPNSTDSKPIWWE